MRYRLPLLIAISPVVIVSQLAPQDARGDDHVIEYQAHDEDRARLALEKGETLPLDRVIARLNGAISGEISGLELEKENGIWIYEFKVISPAGQMVTVRLNAKTGELIGKAEE